MRRVLDGLRGVAVRRSLLVAALLLGVFWQHSRPSVVILGDSIAHGSLALVGPSAYLSTIGRVTDFSRDGNQIRYVTPMIGALPPGTRVYIHVGVNDVRHDTPTAEADLRELLEAIASRPDLVIVIDEVGTMEPARVTRERELVRLRMNAVLHAFRAGHVVVLPFDPDLPDGLHPGSKGYAQQMPRVCLELLRR